MQVLDEQNRLLAKVEHLTNHLYLLGMVIAQPVSLLVKGTKNAWLWHSWLRHLNFQALRRLAPEGLVRGMLEIKHVNQLCTGCLAGKQCRAPFP
jgi:hypothetical protein